MNINELKGVVKQVINESSLSRMHQHISEYDCATITAFRNKPTDGDSCAIPDPPVPADPSKQPSTSDYHPELKNTLDINKKNNSDLKATLLAYGFGITAVDGTYIENFKSQNPDKPPIEVKEDSFFVVNLSNMPQEQFFEVIKRLGKKYCQDSVLLIPKGGKNGAILYGTNHTFPGLDQEVKYNVLDYGREHEFMTKIRNRPLSAINENLETYEKLTGKQRMAVKGIAYKVLGVKL